MNPSAMRRSAAKARSNGGAITVSLGYRPPYLWDEILRFFAARAIPGVETVRGGAYMRAVRFAAPARTERTHADGSPSRTIR